MTTTYDASTIVSSLAAFGELPDWLAAGMDAGRVHESLLRHVPELHDGRVVLLAVRPDRLRAKDADWLARYTLVIAEPGGTHREIVLVGNLWSPGQRRGRPTAERTRPGSRSASRGGGARSPDLRLDLGRRPRTRRCPRCRVWSDPAEAARLLEPRPPGGGVRRRQRSPPATRSSCGTSRAAAARSWSGSGYADGTGPRATGPRSSSRPISGDKGGSAWEAMNALVATAATVVHGRAAGRTARAT